MRNGHARQPTVAILVDNRRRDLMGDALIAHHLEAMGVTCRLEPLAAYRAVLGAYRPDMLVFNHLAAGHLVAYSQRLARLGVLTAVLPNEGIIYDPDVMAFNATRYHRDGHIDHFFCWNEAHRAALLAHGRGEGTRIDVVGVPRFDFYFEPWSALFARGRRAPGSRPRLLLCSNFVFSKYHELPPDRADRFFAPWTTRIPIYRDYRRIVALNHGARARFLHFADALVASGRFDVTLRPHPNEDVRIYREWLARVPAGEQRWVRMEQDRNITGLILDTDVVVSCETCTTSLESWIAGRPTVELVFDREPPFFHEHIAALNPLCDRPEAVVATVEEQLHAPEQRAYAEGRRRHLAEWCSTPDGTSSRRVAAAIAAAVAAKAPGRWDELDWHDRRRGLRLRGLSRLGLPYNHDFLFPIKRRLGNPRYALRAHVHDKTISPGDVDEARALLRGVATGR